MVEVTMQVPEELAARLQPVQSWLPTILEVSLIGYHTPAAETATELISFLMSNPSPQEVLAYHASERSQERLQRLLTLNEAGLLGELEQQEIEELQQIEHILIMLKGEMAQRLRASRA